MKCIKLYITKSIRSGITDKDPGKCQYLLLIWRINFYKHYMFVNIKCITSTQKSVVVLIHKLFPQIESNQIILF